MVRENRYRALALFAALLTASLSLLVVGAGARALDCQSSWSKVPTRKEFNNPRDIAAIARNDVWVVGSKERSVGYVRTGAMHWDGTRWSLFPTPNAGSQDNALLGVDARSGKDIWAVGYSEHNERYKTLIEHYDGSEWRVVNSPNAGVKEYSTLTDVDATSSLNAWAVGSYRRATGYKTLIQRWDGESWSIVPSPDPALLSNSLLGVAATGPTDVWAVGWKSNPNGLRSLVLHRDSSGWNEVEVPAFGTGDNVLTGISAVNGQDVWAAGYFVDGSKYKTLTLHYDGTSWSRVPSVDGADPISILRGIGAFSSSNAWAVGIRYRADQHRYVASTQHWDGDSWTGVPSAIPRETQRDSEMFSVAKEPSTSRVWAVGRPADVETVCEVGGQAAATTNEATEAPASPDISSNQSSEPSSSSSVEVSASDASAPPSASTAFPVKAVNKAADAGIAEDTPTHGAVVSDFNNDRSPDIFLGRHSPAARLYINDGGGHFTETNEGFFSGVDRHGCDAADVNGDNLKDIFCSVGALHGTRAKRNTLYVQRLNHTFADRASKYGVLDTFGRGRLSAFIEANGDSRPDLFVVNDALRGDAMPSPNRLFINSGGSTYLYAPQYGLDREIRDGDGPQGGGVEVGDLDGDGWEDLLVATSSGLKAYHNDQGTGFTEVTASVGLGQSLQDVALANVNGDEWPDVVQVWSRGLRVYINTGGTFSMAFSTSLRYGTDVAAGDVNGDDRADIYVMRGNAPENVPDRVYLNDGDGTSFTRMESIPSTGQGKPDSVEPIDYDQNGLTDFLAMNGAGGGEARQTSGPVQLIAFFPAS